MSSVQIRQWFSLKEASEITGRSLNAIRLLVHRKKISNLKKTTENGREQWMIHRDALSELSCASDVKDFDRCQTCTMRDGGDLSICQEICGKDNSSVTDPNDICQAESTEKASGPAFIMQGKHDLEKDIYVASIPLEHYEKKQAEWSSERDRLIQGILLYRYRYEELENKVKALPAPPEYMQTRVTDLETRLLKESEEKQSAIKDISSQINEIVSESQKMRGVYESQIEEMRNRLKEEEEEKRLITKKFEEREEELAVAISEKELELIQAKKPWWKKIMGY